MISTQIFVSTVFIAGFLSFFAPCTFPLLPVYVGMLIDDSDSKKFFNIGKRKIALKPIAKTLLFVGGLSTTFIILGFGAGALGSLINGRAFIVVSGFIVVLLGLHQIGIFRLKFLEKYKVIRIKKQSKNDFLSSYLLGLTFSFGWTPCVGPVLGAVIVISAGGGQAIYGALLMAVYALGLMIPFLAMALLSNILIGKFEKMEKHLATIKKVGGILIVIMGLLLMTENLNILTAFFESLIS